MTVIEETERELLSKLFELEGLGITSDEYAGNNNFLEYYKKYSDQVSFENGYVTAPYPLKSTVQNLADNYGTALKRLMNLYTHLGKSNIQKEWSKTLNQYEDDDVIERVEGKAPGSVGVYYMPHSGMWRPHKPKPLRVIFDAPSKRKGQLSLNDVTYKGESLVSKIHDILIASRTCKIILVCDIEAAFTQIRLKESHKDLCRFLWLKDASKPPTQDNIIEYRFKRTLSERSRRPAF
uniref:Reverse transcriptase domain-containing protein n=1 Tax=Haemonchus placei TaxID=6290 RepID=A0A0N4WJ86_HAEPC